MPENNPPENRIVSPLGGTATRTVVFRVLLAVAAVVVLTVLVVMLFVNDSGDETTSSEEVSADATAVDSELIVRENSHFLDEAPESDVTFVEFLDFECEACGAVYPAIEQLREEYEGEINFVIRYFPLDGHPNSRQAAHAVEAAARQDQLEPMYQRMFETQEEWSHNEQPQDDVFRGFAEDLGLDVEQWESDYFSDEVADRVQADFEDAVELGLRGTPSFFVNDQQVSPQSLDELTDPIDAALDEQ